MKFIILFSVIFAATAFAKETKKKILEPRNCPSNMIRLDEKVVDSSTGTYAWVDSIARRSPYDGKKEMLFLFRIHSSRYRDPKQKIAVGFLFTNPDDSVKGHETTQLNYDASTKVFYGAVVVPEAGPEGQSSIFVREKEDQPERYFTLQKNLASFRQQQPIGLCY